MAPLAQFCSGVFAVQDLFFWKLPTTPLPIPPKRTVCTLVLLICSEKSDLGHFRVKIFVINTVVDFG